VLLVWSPESSRSSRSHVVEVYVQCNEGFLGCGTINEFV
jgi:hypothetical protein